MNKTPIGDEVSLAKVKAGGLFFSVLFFSVFTNLLMLTGPLFMLQVYDRVLGSRSEETLVALFALVGLLYFFYWLLEFARGRVMARVGARFQSALNKRVFGAVLERSALQRDSQNGNLQDLDAIRNLFGSPVVLSLFDIPWTPVFLLAIFIFHPVLGWIALAGGGVLVAATVLNQALTRHKTREANNSARASAQFVHQAELGADTLWAQGMGTAMTARWVELQEAGTGQALAASDWTGSFTSFTRAFRLFLQSAMLAVGAWLVLQNTLTAGAMIAASILLGRALSPIEAGLSNWSSVQRARSGWQDLQALLADIPTPPSPSALPAPAAHFAVKDVSLTIRRGEKPLLQKISFHIAPGEALGVIGRSGSGKTTLARMLVGLIPPTSGNVRLAGATLDQYGTESLGTFIGYLPQNVTLFDGTVGENIAQMSMAPDQEKIIIAANKALIHEAILQLPNGYDTHLGGTETRLSGGQKQRLALARALYNDPVLLILDEPNSALDADGSEALNAVISNMKAAGCAVLIMTHRPTAISTCDRLLVLEDGKTAGYGPREEIIKAMMKNAGDVRRTIEKAIA